MSENKGTDPKVFALVILLAVLGFFIWWRYDQAQKEFGQRPVNWQEIDRTLKK